jgi:UDP-2-acetamido-2-deoxy-ribo-hexuluronate aminotransferase
MGGAVPKERPETMAAVQRPAGVKRSQHIEFVDLKFQYAALKESIDARIHRVLDHGQYIMGPEVKELEERLAAYTAAGHCATVASGTEALLISLMALGVKPGDEVVTTSFSFAATAEVIVLLGAKPVFVDIEPDTCNIDASRIEATITPRTRAIIPVSLYGQVADMDEINDVAARHGNIPVVEDGAQSFGADYRGRKSCNLSTIGCTSFFPSKPLGCYGDGGAIFTNDDDIAKAIREIRVHGQESRYNHTRVGLGGRMDTLQCAIVLAKLDRFEWEVRRRAEIGGRYTKLLAGLMPAITVLPVRSDRTSVYAQYTIRARDRTRLQQTLNAAEIPTAIHYPRALHHQPAYAEVCRGESFPVAEKLAGEVISLPMHPYLEETTQDRIVEAIRASAK